MGDLRITLISHQKYINIYCLFERCAVCIPFWIKLNKKKGYIERTIVAAPRLAGILVAQR